MKKEKEYKQLLKNNVNIQKHHTFESTGYLFGKVARNIYWTDGTESIESFDVYILPNNKVEFTKNGILRFNGKLVSDFYGNVICKGNNKLYQFI